MTENCIGVYYILLVLFGILQYFSVQPPESVDLNWFKDVISDIEIVSGDQQCPDEFKSLLNFDWPGINEGYQCQDEIKDKQTKETKCQKLQQIRGQVINTFAFIEPTTGGLQPFKLCGKTLPSVNLFNSKSISEAICETDEQICYFQNKPLCIQKGKTCFESIQQCQEQDQICQYKHKSICIKRDEICPKYDGICNQREKPCFIKDRIICIEENENCPITRILIENKLQSSNKIIQSRILNNKQQEIHKSIKYTIQNSKSSNDINNTNKQNATSDKIKDKIFDIPSDNYEEVKMSMQSDFQFYVIRSSGEESAIVEFQISSEDGVCLNRQQSTDKELYHLEKQVKCKDEIDSRFNKFLQNSITAKQLYASNKINLGKHAEHIPNESKYDLYYRRYFGYSDICDFTSDDVKQILALQSSVQDFSFGFFCCSIVLFITFVDLKRNQNKRNEMEQNQLYFQKKEKKTNIELFYSWHLGVYIINVFYITCLFTCFLNIDYQIEPLMNCNDHYLRKDISQYILHNEGQEIIRLLTFMYWLPIIILLYQIICRPRIKCRCCFSF